jgi:hypothetical protein
LAKSHGCPKHRRNGLVVTHDIEEVVDVGLPRPRHLDSSGYLEKRDRIFHVMGMSLRVGETVAA